MLDDPLTDVLRAGARRLLAQAVEQEAAAFLSEMKGLRLSDGRDRVVRHGHGPERAVQTGIGPVPVSRVKIRDRGATDGDHIRFTSAILPRWAWRTKSLDALLPTLYLWGVSTGDFQEALSALLVTAAAKTWRKLKGENQLPKVIQGVKFINGVELIDPASQHAA